MVARNPSVRASDAEREEVAGVLRDNLAEGRLTMEEFQERLDAAYSSRTYGELDALMVDLPRPAGTAPMTLSETGAHLAGRWEDYRRGRARRRISRFVSVNAVCWTIWGATVASSAGHNLEGMWPLWITVPWGALIVSRRPPHLGQPRSC